MSSYSRQSIPNRWHSSLTMTAACIACWSVVTSAPAQKSHSQTVVASLSISTIQPEFILASVRERPSRPAPRVAEHTESPLPVLHGPPTDVDAWEDFDSEFRPEPRSRSLVKRQIETANYGLDTIAFAVDRFVKSIRDHADFNVDQGRLQHTLVTPLERSQNNPRVKLDLDLTHGAPYAGVRIVIPFGN